MANRLYFLPSFLFGQSSLAVALSAVVVALAVELAVDSPSDRHKVQSL